MNCSQDRPLRGRNWVFCRSCKSLLWPCPRTTRLARIFSAPAAKALNGGAEEPTVQLAGMLSSFTMQEVRTVAAEFRADDDEWESETRKAHLHSLSSR